MKIIQMNWRNGEGENFVLFSPDIDFCKESTPGQREAKPVGMEVFRRSLWSLCLMARCDGRQACGTMVEPYYEVVQCSFYCVGRGKLLKDVGERDGII